MHRLKAPAGRVPALNKAKLDAAGVAHKKGAAQGAADTEQMGPPLTLVSSHERRSSSAPAGSNDIKPGYAAVPSVGFTYRRSRWLRRPKPKQASRVSDPHAKPKGSQLVHGAPGSEPTHGFNVLVRGDGPCPWRHLIGPRRRGHQTSSHWRNAMVTADHLKTTTLGYPTDASVSVISFESRCRAVKAGLDQCPAQHIRWQRCGCCCANSARPS